MPQDASTSARSSSTACRLDRCRLADGTEFVLWEHDQSGEVYAIRLDARGRVTGCRGPLLGEEIRLDHLAEMRYDEDPATLAWIEAHRESWMPHELQFPPRYF